MMARQQRWLLLPPVLLLAIAKASAGGGGCGGLGVAPALELGAGGAIFTFGTELFALTFDAATLALLNVSTCTAGNASQGFLWPAAAGGGGVDKFSLWQLAYSDCTVAMPSGSQLDALATAASITLAAELGTPIGFHWCVNQPPELHVTVDFTTFIYVFSSQEGCFGIRLYFLAQFIYELSLTTGTYFCRLTDRDCVDDEHGRRYGWNTEVFDTHYPVYTPKPGFASATAALQAANVHVVPYTNGRLFDPHDPKYHWPTLPHTLSTIKSLHDYLHTVHTPAVQYIDRSTD